MMLKLNSKKSAPLAALMTFSLAYSPSAFAWGERGHDGITRVATRILADNKDPEIQKFGAFLQKKENMLGHLANVPDIVWRSLSPELDKASTPSHFIDLDYILVPGKTPTAEDLPGTMDAYLKALDKNCGKKAKDWACAPGKDLGDRLLKAGHAPYRVDTLTQDLVQAFKDLKAMDKIQKDSPDFEKKNTAVDRILLLSGILSHFVGDLANPHHTSKDYDGWETGQGGLHGYFETEIVDSLGLDLEANVLDEAERHEPMAKPFAKHPHNYLQQAFELTLDSHEKLPILAALDLQNSLLAKSSEDKDEGDKSVKGRREKAKRKEPSEVNTFYRNFVILRLATGADALARFWLDAWQEGGKPDLSFYRSYHYDVKPDFVPMRYLPQGK
ncbi:MAG: hypothetical protein H7318_13120 [Oligoflexus sp.]|nr:hypothetical protein [Oligoflexus sp.]